MKLCKTEMNCFNFTSVKPALILRKRLIEVSKACGIEADDEMAVSGMMMLAKATDLLNNTEDHILVDGNPFRGNIEIEFRKFYRAKTKEMRKLHYGKNRTKSIK